MVLLNGVDRGSIATPAEFANPEVEVHEPQRNLQVAYNRGSLGFS